MDSFRFKSSERILPLHSIRVLRQFTMLGIAELKARAANDQALLEFSILDNKWPESKRTIKRLLADIESGELPLEIYEYNKVDAHSSEEELLSIDRFKERLKMLREIEFEQDKAAQLEMGYIESSEEYEPTDEDEA